MPKHNMTVLDLLQFLSDKPLDMPVCVSMDGPPRNEDWTIKVFTSVTVGNVVPFRSVHQSVSSSYEQFGIWNPSSIKAKAIQRPVLIIVPENE